MNLFERKATLQRKIQLNKELVDEKQVEFNFHRHNADRLQHVIENLMNERYKDQTALEELEKEIAAEVPTLAVQNTNHQIFKDVSKAIATIIFLLISTFSFAQPFVGMEAGNRMGINTGIIYKNIEVKGGALIPYTRRADISNVTYAQLGYKIGNAINVTPLVGIAHYHVSKFDKDLNERVVNKNVLSKSLEIGHDFTTRSNHYGNYYLFISQAQEVYAGAGLKIYVK